MNDPEPSRVAMQCVVGLRYIMRNSNDEVLENTMTGETSHYLQGGTAIMPALQQQLEGLRAGDRKSVVLPAGRENDHPEYRFDVLIRSVRMASGAELILGYPLPLTADCGPDCECHVAGSPGQD